MKGKSLVSGLSKPEIILPQTTVTVKSSKLLKPKSFFYELIARRALQLYDKSKIIFSTLTYHSTIFSQLNYSGIYYCIIKYF